MDTANLVLKVASTEPLNQIIQAEGDTPASTITLQDVKVHIVSDSARYDELKEAGDEEALEDSGVIVATRRFAYPLTATKEEISQDLKKFLDTFREDEDRKAANEEADAIAAAATETAEAISGLTIK